ncbi:hypothetical protein TNCV_1944581 [Trichonephila clavipes]|nr:hypothetical protein TNCV_1944581 [Trichonephila clavipes]
MTTIEDVFGDAQGSVTILLSLLPITQTLNQELWSGSHFLTAGPIWPSLKAHLQNRELIKHFLNQPDLSPIEHVWDMMGRQLPLPWNVDDIAH